MVTPFHQRMAELWLQSKKRPLSPSEAAELEQCQQLNVNFVSEAAYLANMSLLASMSKDVDWQHEICKEIEQFQLTGKRKKSGTAGAE
ncbi:hypothetical protein [Paenibacillus sp. BIHB 4019]|nr:hypothetical protein [Paenibacillus sp. BIHB 4019]